jgi:hypothetical protein
VAISKPANVFPEPGTPVIKINDFFLLLFASFTAVITSVAVSFKFIAPASDLVISLTE